MGTIFSRILTDARNRLKMITNRDLKKAGLTPFKVRKLKYSTNSKPAQFNLHGQKIHYLSGIELLYSLREIFIDEIYKIKFDKPDPYIVDCGANIGLSVLYLKTLYPDARIIAFEPDQSSFSLLKVNCSNLKDVTVLNKAVWKENTNIIFESSGSLSSKIVKETPATGTNIVEAIRLKDYLDRPIDLLKLDIEGAEYEVLRDAKDGLGSIKNLFIEYHGKFEQNGELNEIFSLLYDAGFVYYIKEATDNYHNPFYRDQKERQYDIQLNIFCFKK
ncbi:MAG TPA: FkbM family methyltransferase [Chitinophagaceae bacterium]|nr:FkbM family methyltransferase [Chitinophagaceae bacterium]